MQPRAEVFRPRSLSSRACVSASWCCRVFWSGHLLIATEDRKYQPGEKERNAAYPHTICPSNVLLTTSHTAKHITHPGSAAQHEKNCSLEAPEGERYVLFDGDAVRARILHHQNIQVEAAEASLEEVVDPCMRTWGGDCFSRNRCSTSRLSCLPSVLEGHQFGGETTLHPLGVVSGSKSSRCETLI